MPNGRLALNMRLPNGYLLAKIRSLSISSGVGRARLASRPEVEVTFHDFTFHIIKEVNGRLDGERPSGTVPIPDVSASGEPEIVVWLKNTPRRACSIRAVYWGFRRDLEAALGAIKAKAESERVPVPVEPISVAAADQKKNEAAERIARLCRRGRGFPLLRKVA